jgi:hypothetical protein
VEADEGEWWDSEGTISKRWCWRGQAGFDEIGALGPHVYAGYREVHQGRGDCWCGRGGYCWAKGGEFVH